MFERVGSDYIIEAVKNLIGVLGVREELACDDLVRLVRQGELEQVARAIARYLTLRVQIQVESVPTRGSQRDPVMFQSTALSTTDSSGHGSDAILAQVSFPTPLPMYGTSGLAGTLVHIKVMEDCRELPELFIAVMCHELSHVLLHSLRHPRREDELYTDLVPLVLGFSRAVAAGRKTRQTQSYGRMTVTESRDAGYLTDSHFHAALGEIRLHLAQRRSQKHLVMGALAQVRSEIDSVDHDLTVFERFLKHLDGRQPGSLSEQRDGIRIVAFHSVGYNEALKEQSRGAGRLTEKVDSFAVDAVHYTDAVLEQFGRFHEQLQQRLRDLADAHAHLRDDVRVMERNIGVVRKWLIKRRLRRDSTLPTGG